MLSFVWFSIIHMFFYLVHMEPSQAALQALIEEIEALGWDFPDQLNVIEDASPNQVVYALISKLITLKPQHTQLVHATLAAAWNFAAPLAVEFLVPNKFLFAVLKQNHVDCILQQGPWNIRGSLLLLQPWSPWLSHWGDWALPLSILDSSPWAPYAKYDHPKMLLELEKLWIPL